MSAFLPPPAGLPSPMAWGSELHLQELFGGQASHIRTTRKTYAFRFRSPEHWVEFFRAYYGPTHKAFAAVGELGQRGLYEALIELLRRENTHHGDALVVPAEYLEVVITK
jgi:hypothetical protein